MNRENGWTKRWMPMVERKSTTFPCMTADGIEEEQKMLLNHKRIDDEVCCVNVLRYVVSPKQT